MNDQVVHIVAEALLTATKIAGPVLVATLAIGLLLSVVQSATQVQESTLTFLPKLFAAALVLVLTGSLGAADAGGLHPRPVHAGPGPAQGVTPP